MSSKRIILYHQKDNSSPTGEDGLGLYFRRYFMKRLKIIEQNGYI